MEEYERHDWVKLKDRNALVQVFEEEKDFITTVYYAKNGEEFFDNIPKNRIEGIFLKHNASKESFIKVLENLENINDYSDYWNPNTIRQIWNYFKYKDWFTMEIEDRLQSLVIDFMNM